MKGREFRRNNFLADNKSPDLHTEKELTKLSKERTMVVCVL